MAFATFELRVLAWVLIAWLVLVLVVLSVELGLWPLPVVAWSLLRRWWRRRRYLEKVAV